MHPCLAPGYTHKEHVAKRIPIEMRRVPDALHGAVPDLLLVHLDRDQGLDIGALHFRQVHPRDLRELVLDGQDALAALPHGLLLLGLRGRDGLLHVGGPKELQPQQRHLRCARGNAHCCGTEGPGRAALEEERG